MNIQSIDDKIFKRLQSLFDVEDPLQFRDIFIVRSGELGSNLLQSQLEDEWFQMVIKEFNDEDLEDLVRAREIEFILNQIRNKVA